MVHSGLFCCGCFGVAEVQLSIREKMSSVSSSSLSSSLLPPSSWSRAAAVYVVCSCVVGWVIVVVVMGCGESCWFLESAAHTITVHRVPFRFILCRGEPDRVAREIVVVLAGKYALWSSSHLLASLPCFWYPLASLISLDFSWKYAQSSGLRGVRQSSLPASNTSFSV